MSKKVNDEYFIPTEEFCAVNYNFEKRFFLKEVRPDVQCEVSNCLEKALDIGLVNGRYPDIFIENTTSYILEKNDLSSYIPIKIIRRYNKDGNHYCKCVDLFSNNIFVIPLELLQKNLSDNKIYDNYWYNYVTNMEFMLDLYSQLLNKPKKTKKLLKLKDTK